MNVDNLTPKKPLVVAAALVLVLSSFILMLYDIEAGLNIVMWITVMISRGPVNGKAVGTIVAFFLGAVGLSFMAFSADYNIRHAGEPRSFRLLGISIGIQAAVALIGLVLL